MYTHRQLCIALPVWATHITHRPQLNKNAGRITTIIIYIVTWKNTQNHTPVENITLYYKLRVGIWCCYCARSQQRRTLNVNKKQLSSIIYTPIRVCICNFRNIERIQNICVLCGRQQASGEVWITNRNKKNHFGRFECKCSHRQ